MITRSFCEVCESEFLPRTADEDDIICPPCKRVVNDDRGSWVEMRKDNERRRTGLVVKPVPHRATPSQIEALRLAQGGRCAICGSQPTQLVTDHNHRTGEVRALLCGDCNKGLGCMGDHPTILAKAAAYLETHGYYGAYPRPPEVVRTRK